MSDHLQENTVFERALRFVEETGKSIFLTGKAGTGKTTFLRYLRAHSVKKMAVVAPTGVAAINAGGVTIHSLFQLPPGTHLPVEKLGDFEANAFITDQYTLSSKINFSYEKKQLLQELDLLVIDEVSMLRADLLDAIDFMLRTVRNNLNEDFGGVQVLFIGDLFQLPPVVANDEWSLLRRFYQGPFFFQSVVLRKSPPVYIELKTIYRQTDTAFIELLNKVRNNRTTHVEIEQLRQYYKPEYRNDKLPEGYITLTTHNSKAELINQKALEALDSPVHSMKGKIDGDFNDKSLPVEMTIQLKVGAQVMFVKNDKGESRRYFNGKIGTVTAIDDELIEIETDGGSNLVELEKETWKNIRYRFNKEKNKIEEEELGSFTQYPLRLAWAITIHKSQGLTFEKAVIDAGEAFAPGQVYVALSRLTSLDGLILLSRIEPTSITTDERVLQFASKETNDEDSDRLLEQERDVYVYKLLVKSFDFSSLKTSSVLFVDDFPNLKIPEKQKALGWAETLTAEAEKQAEVAVKFQSQLRYLLQNREANSDKIQERVSAGVRYFVEWLKEADKSIDEHIKEYAVKSRTIRYIRLLEELLTEFRRKKKSLSNAVKLLNASNGELANENIGDRLREFVEAPTVNQHSGNGKAKRQPSNEITLQFFNEGKSIDEIAAVRALSRSTIESHLVSLIVEGKLAIEEFVTAEKQAVIGEVLSRTDIEGFKAAKAFLGEEFSYGEIRAVSYYRTAKFAK